MYLAYPGISSKEPSKFNLKRVSPKTSAGIEVGGVMVVPVYPAFEPMVKRNPSMKYPGSESLGTGRLKPMNQTLLPPVIDDV